MMASLTSIFFMIRIPDYDMVPKFKSGFSVVCSSHVCYVGVMKSPLDRSLIY